MPDLRNTRPAIVPGRHHRHLLHRFARGYKQYTAANYRWNVKRRQDNRQALRKVDIQRLDFLRAGVAHDQRRIIRTQATPTLCVQQEMMATQETNIMS